MINTGQILAFVDVDVRPDVLSFSHHAGLPSSNTDFNESGDLLGLTVLNSEIDKFTSGKAIDGRGKHDVGLHISF